MKNTTWNPAKGSNPFLPANNGCGILLRTHCSNACIFCRPLGENHKKSPKEMARMEKDIYWTIDKFRQQGFTSIEVSGEDPLEYKKLPGLISLLRKKGFQWVRVATNGVKLSDECYTKDLLSAGVDVFRIPLYGAEASLHDAITRTKGSFDHVVRGIKNLRKANKARILLSSLLLVQNRKGLGDIFDLMYALGCDDLFFSPVLITNNDYSYKIPYFLQGHYFRSLIKHAFEQRRPLRLVDVPFCVVGFDNIFSDNLQKPAPVGERFQPTEGYKTPIQNMPIYRMKTKVEICRECAVSYKCDGFWINDIGRYGIGQLKAIKKATCPKFVITYLALNCDNKESSIRHTFWSLKNMPFH